MKKRETPPSGTLPMPPPDPSLADKILLAATSRSGTGGAKHVCRICGGSGAIRKDDMLCWVCRRLKNSAWRDVEKLGTPE
jgi:hypothetical protein